MMTVRIKKRANAGASSLDELPSRALVMSIPTAQLLKQRTCHLHLAEPPDPDRYVLVENGMAHAVVEVGKLDVIESSRGHKKVKGYPFTVHGVFKSPLPTNVAKDATGVIDDVELKMPGRAQESLPSTSAQEAHPSEEDVREPIESVTSEKATVSKPFAGFEDFDACVAHQQSMGHDAESARAICGKLQAEAEKAKGKKKPWRYGKAQLIAVARQTAIALKQEDEDEDEDVSEEATARAGEGGIHQHVLNRTKLTSEVDGEHQHLFLLPDGTVVATALDGGHQHGMRSADADVSEAGVSAHKHTVLMPDGSTMETSEDGEHMHSLQVSLSAVDGLHQHELELPGGKVLQSLTPGQFWALTQDGDASEDDSVGELDVRASKRLHDKLGTIHAAARGLKLSAPVLSLVDSDDESITLMLHGPLSDTAKRAIEKAVAARLPETVAVRLRTIDDTFGVPGVATVPLATASIDFGDAFPVLTSKSDDFVRLPVGKQRAVMQYAFDGEDFGVLLRFQAEDELVSWALEGVGRGHALRDDIASVRDVAEVVKAADLDGSRYQCPLRGAWASATPSISASLVWLDHEGKAHGSDVSGIVVTAAKANVEFGLQRDGFHEYFVSGSDVLRGVIVAKRDHTGAWALTVQKDHLPAVLSPAAVEAGIMPPHGRSGLPASLECEVPDELRYWRAATPKAALALRDALVKTRLFCADTVQFVDNEFRRVYVRVEHSIAPALEPVDDRAPRPQPPVYVDPVHKVAQLLPDAGTDVVLFDRSLAVSTPPSRVCELAIEAARHGEDFLVAYPDSPGSRLALSKCGRLFKLPGHGDTLFVTSSTIRSDVVMWLAEPAPMIEVGGSERVTALLKRMGSEHRVRVLKAPEERFVLGVVLEPETIDAQGDIYSAEEIRKAAHLYMEEFGHLKLMHDGEYIDGKAVILENYVSLVAMDVDGQHVKRGTWLLGSRVVDDSLWDAIKSGKLTGLSIGGTALKMPL